MSVKMELEDVKPYFLKDAVVLSERDELMKSLIYVSPSNVLRSVLNYYLPQSMDKKWYVYVRQNIEQTLDKKVKVHVFGAVDMGLDLKDAVLDVYLEPLVDASPMVHYELFKDLLAKSILFSDVSAIRRNRLPIIQCKHELSEVKAEITVQYKPNGVYTSNFIRDLVSRDVRFRELFLFVKIWAKKLKLIGDDGLTSYCLNVLIIISLQVHSRLPSIKELQMCCVPRMVRGVNFAYFFTYTVMLPLHTTTLDLLKSFFCLYETANFEEGVLSPFLGSYVEKGHFFLVQEKLLREEGSGRGPPSDFQLYRSMCVQDLFDLKLNVAKGVSQSKMKYLKECSHQTAEAFFDTKLMAEPKKLFEYLLFDLPEKLVVVPKQKTGPLLDPKIEVKIELKIEPKDEPE